ncbi:MAG: SCO family protein [Desulfotalea sp.]|nr:MAG: SCO family protein [Desulfotalea sp.]
MIERQVTHNKTAQRKQIILILILFPILLMGCEQNNNDKFRVFGEVTEDFQFRNQDNQLITRDIFNGKVVVTDFFFTRCLSICPIMKRQMARIYAAYPNQKDLLLFSHTIDPDNDTVEVLKNYSKGLGIKTESWQMVTGPQEEIFTIAKSNYMLGALKDENSQDGYIHSGSFVLIDKNHKIRGYYDGTDEKAVDRLIVDLKEFLGEK